MSDVLLSNLMPALDLFVVERRSDSSFAVVAPRPRWLTPALGSDGDSPFALVRMFPFLDGFLQEAEAFWRTGAEGRLTSGVFAAGSGPGEILLRASALNVGPRCALVLERLLGSADPRPLLQKAREHTLEAERLARQLSAAQAATATISRLATQLLETPLTDPQREGVERIIATTRG